MANKQASGGKAIANMERLELGTIIYGGKTLEEGAVATITLNRTERLNALCQAMAKQNCGKGKFGWP